MVIQCTQWRDQLGISLNLRLQLVECTSSVLSIHQKYQKQYPFTFILAILPVIMNWLLKMVCEDDFFKRLYLLYNTIMLSHAKGNLALWHAEHLNPINVKISELRESLESVVSEQKYLKARDTRHRHSKYKNVSCFFDAMNYKKNPIVYRLGLMLLFLRSLIPWGNNQWLLNSIGSAV